MKKYKYYTEPIIQFFVGTAGGVAITLAATFGWHIEAKGTASILGIHSVILITLGLGLLAASVYIRRSAQRLVALETQLSKLHSRED